MKILGFLLHFRVLGLLTLILFGCKNSNFESEKVKFIIYSQKKDSFNNLFASVYVSDTNWIEMAEFADSLVDGHGPQSGVSFYADSNNIPIINEFYSYEPVGVQQLAYYIMPSKFRVFDEEKEIDESEDLSFKLITYNDVIFEIEDPYHVDYKEVNMDIKYHNSYDYNSRQTQKTASKFINLILESKLDMMPDLFVGEMDKKQVQKIHKLLLGTEWENVSKSKGGSFEKYNLWFKNFNFSTDTDTLKIKIHFDINNSVDKIERVEYSYVD